MIALRSGHSRRVLCALVCYVLAGCGLLSNSPPLDIRYFSPPSGNAAAGIKTRAGTPPIELGRVSSAAHLRYRIVYRASSVEMGLYDALRWAERPDTYVQRALAHELFEVRGMTEAVGGTAPELDVEVIAFEEVRRGTRRSGRVQLRYQLEDPDVVLASGVITVERDAGDAHIESVVAAIGAAMTAASAQLADVVAANLRRPRPPLT